MECLSEGERITMFVTSLAGMFCAGRLCRPAWMMRGDWVGATMVQLAFWAGLCVIMTRSGGLFFAVQAAFLLGCYL